MRPLLLMIAALAAVWLVACTAPKPKHPAGQTPQTGATNPMPNTPDKRGSSGQPDAPATPPATRRIGAERFRRTVKTAVGEVVDLALAENHTTGFRWECKWEPADGLALVRDGFEASRTSATGAGGTRHLLLRPRKPGEVNITLQYRRPWEKGEAESAKTIVLEVAQK